MLQKGDIISTLKNDLYTNIVFVKSSTLLCVVWDYLSSLLYIIPFVNITQLIFMHLTADGHLDDLQYGVIMNSVALNMLAHVF